MTKIHSFFYSLLSLLVIIQQCAAMMTVDTPDGSTNFTVVGGEVTIPISWEDDGDDPSDDNISTYTFVLCTGDNDNIQSVASVKDIAASDITDSSYDAIFEGNVAKDGTFYIQIYSVFQNGGYMIRYSERFDISGMSGTIETSGSGSPPSGEINYDDDAAANHGDTSKSFTIPYTLQTGKTRYAPMQMQPNSKVTVSSWSRRFASSAVTYYSTIRPSPVVLSTVTPGWSYTMSSFINYASPAPFPSVVGWYAASERLVSATLDSSYAEKRKLMKRRWAD